MGDVKRVLLVAPQVNLAYAHSEIEAVVNSGLMVRLLNHDVTEDAIADRLLNEEFDILWFATHTTDEEDGRIQIGHNRYMTATVLAQICRNASLDLVYLNTCQSWGAAAIISQEIGSDLICTVGEVDDRLAFRTGAIFARRLAGSDDYRKAFEYAKPARNRTYVYLDNWRRMERMNEKTHKLLEEIRNLLSSIVAHLGLDARQDHDDNGRRIIFAILIGAGILASAIMFLGFWLAAGG